MDGLSQLLTQRASKAAKSGVREVMFKSAGLIVALLLFVCAFLFGLLAIFHSFAATHGPVATAALMCLGLFILAVIVLLIADRQAHHEKLRREASTEVLEAGYKTAVSLVSQLGGTKGKGKLALPLAAVVIGYLLSGRSDDET